MVMHCLCKNKGFRMTRPATEEEKREWKEKIQKQKLSGLSIEGYCRENHIAPHRFYYWRSQLFPNDLKPTSFVEIKDKKSLGLAFECWDMRIFLNQDFDPLTLKKFLKVIKEISC
jgi:hypothetical protein